MFKLPVYVSLNKNNYVSSLCNVHRDQFIAKEECELPAPVSVLSRLYLDGKSELPSSNSYTFLMQNSDLQTNLFNILGNELPRQFTDVKFCHFTVSKYAILSWKYSLTLHICKRYKTSPTYDNTTAAGPHSLKSLYYWKHGISRTRVLFFKALLQVSNSRHGSTTCQFYHAVASVSLSPSELRARYASWNYSTLESIKIDLTKRYDHQTVAN